MTVKKSKTDFDVIKTLFHITPIDWARRDDGSLAFISPTGQKFVFTDEKLEQIAESIRKLAAAAKPPEKPGTLSSHKPARKTGSKAKPNANKK